MDGYQQVFFHMKDDTDFSGMVRSETTDTVTIIDSLGKTNILQKSKIATRKTSQISLMPEGLQSGLSREEFSDLITFLEGRRSEPPRERPARVAGAPPDSPLMRSSQRQRRPEPPPSEPVDFLNLKLPRQIHRQHRLRQQFLLRKPARAGGPVNAPDLSTAGK